MTTNFLILKNNFCGFSIIRKINVSSDENNEKKRVYLLLIVREKEITRHSTFIKRALSIIEALLMGKK